MDQVKIGKFIQEKRKYLKKSNFFQLSSFKLLT